MAEMLVFLAILHFFQINSEANSSSSQSISIVVHVHEWTNIEAVQNLLDAFSDVCLGDDIEIFVYRSRPASNIVNQTGPQSSESVVSILKSECHKTESITPLLFSPHVFLTHILSETESRTTAFISRPEELDVRSIIRSLTACRSGRRHRTARDAAGPAGRRREGPAAFLRLAEITPWSPGPDDAELRDCQRGGSDPAASACAFDLDDYCAHWALAAGPPDARHECLRLAASPAHDFLAAASALHAARQFLAAANRGGARWPVAAAFAADPACLPLPWSSPVALARSWEPLLSGGPRAPGPPPADAPPTADALLWAHFGRLVAPDTAARLHPLDFRAPGRSLKVRLSLSLATSVSLAPLWCVRACVRVRARVRPRTHICPSLWSVSVHPPPLSTSE